MAVMAPIRDKFCNRRWLAHVLCASALLAHGAFAAPPDALVSPQEHAITQQFQNLAPPKTNAFKPQRSDWKPYKKLQNRVVYRHANEVLVRAAAMTTLSTLTLSVDSDDTMSKTITVRDSCEVLAAVFSILLV